MRTCVTLLERKILFSTSKMSSQEVMRCCLFLAGVERKNNIFAISLRSELGHEVHQNLVAQREFNLDFNYSQNRAEADLISDDHRLNYRLVFVSFGVREQY